MKALTTFISIALLAFSTTACSQQHTYRSGNFGGKTVKASKNYVTKDIKVNNFTKLSVASPAQTSTFPSQARETSTAAISLAMTSKYPLQAPAT